MQVVVRISSQTKRAAEDQALRLGYPSLAALLKVTATLLAGRAEADQAKAASPAVGKLPHLDQFKEWPAHISPLIATTDPDLYAFFIQTCIIR